MPDVLKILLIVLLAVFCFLMLTVLLLLFVPFRYDLDLKYGKGEADGKIGIKWLFGVGGGSAELHRRRITDGSIRLCGFRLFDIRGTGDGTDGKC